MARLTENELYYLRSIKANIDRFHDIMGEHVEIAGISLGSEVLADNRNWLDCFIDAEARSTDREPGFVKPDTDRQVFFYEQDFYVLSNFSAFMLHWRGKKFYSSETAYHYEKFVGVEDAAEVRLMLLGAMSAHDAFKIAERNKHHRRHDWDDVKVDVMRRILRAKVEQHEYVRRKLLATGDRELIEDSWRDDFWGWGPQRGGLNMLGKLWMEVRAELRAATPQVNAQPARTLESDNG